ncbi:hypothetical protein EB118_15840 [bacterium]|nr:hypothetical protein [bacterium]NDD83765.1 hypothetical protein [bacterium]NDG31527.1 hypothetical protein [bacterium]
MSDLQLALYVALVMFVIEGVLIALYPITKAEGDIASIRLFAAIGIVAGSFLTARYIQRHYFTVETDLDVFLTAFLVVVFELFAYNKYQLQDFTGKSDMDPFNKVLGKFAFTAVAVFIAKGFKNKLM